MGNNVSFVVLTFGLIPVSGIIFSHILNAFYPFKRLSDIAEINFVKLALKNYVKKKKLEVNEDYSYENYPQRVEYFKCFNVRKSNPVFTHYLNTNNRYYGIDDIILKNGVICGIKMFPSGRFEDFLYYITNHNKLLGMYFVDIECNSSHSWRFGLIWYAQQSFPFFLYALLNLMLLYLYNGKNQSVSFTFTFIFLPIKFVIQFIIDCLMKSRTIIHQENNRRWCLKCILFCKDYLLGGTIIFISTLFYIFGAFIAEFSINNVLKVNNNNSNIRDSNIFLFVWYFIGSGIFYSILSLIFIEYINHVYFNSWKVSKYYELLKDNSDIECIGNNNENINENDTKKVLSYIENKNVKNILHQNSIIVSPDLFNDELLENDSLNRSLIVNVHNIDTDINCNIIRNLEYKLNN